MKAGDLRDASPLLRPGEPVGLSPVPGGEDGRHCTLGFPVPCGSARPGWPLGRDFPLCMLEMCSKLPALARSRASCLFSLTLSSYPTSCGPDGLVGCMPCLPRSGAYARRP